MEAQSVVTDLLEKIPPHSHELGALAAELQNFLIPTPTMRMNQDNMTDSKDSLTEEEDHPAEYVPITKEMVHHLLSRVCALLSTEEHPLWIGSAKFLARYVSKSGRDGLAQKTARLVAGAFLGSIQAKAASELKFMLKYAKLGLEAIMSLWMGSNGLGLLTTHDLICLFQELTDNGKVPVHFILHPLFDKVERERRALSSILLPPDGNFPLLGFFYDQGDEWRLQKIYSWKEIEKEAEQFRKLGCLGSAASQLDDLLHQNAPLEVILRYAERAGESVLDGLMRRVSKVCRSIQRGHDFVTPRTDYRAGDTNPNFKLAIPSNTRFFDVVQELGEQVYVIVSQKKLHYGEIVDAFLELVEPKLGEGVGKDNTLLWLILQLFHLERLRPEIANDFSTDEVQFQKLIRMYNHIQTESTDAYHLRDLALQCALIHQQESILDRPNLKSRLPGLVPVLKYSHVTFLLHNEFIKSRELIGQVTLFDPATPEEQVKLGVIGQMRQGQFPQSLFVNLVPGKPDYGRVVYNDCTCVLGGTISYHILDQLPVDSKQQLLDLILNMALTLDKPPAASTKSLHPATCVSPALVDTLFRLIYSAPSALDPRVRSLFNVVKTHSCPQSPVHMRWYITILQLINFRLLRHFSNHPSTLLISCLPPRQSHPQLQLEAEELSTSTVSLLVSLEQLQALDCSRPTLLFECRHNAIMFVMRVSALLARDGLGTHKLMLSNILAKLPPLKLNMNFPLEVPELKTLPITLPQARDFLMAHTKLHEPLLQGQDINALVDLYSLPENQAFFLPVLWGILSNHGSLTPSIVTLLQLVLPKLSPIGKYERTCNLLFAILPALNLGATGNLLTELIFKYHAVMFHHVLFALSCDGLLSDFSLRWDVIKYLLLFSPGFKSRYTFWEDLKLDRHFWREADYFKKHFTYLTSFPEPHQFSPNSPWMETGYPLPHMPIYFGNLLLRTLSCMEYVMDAWIRGNQFEMLVNFLNEYPNFLKYHQLPLTTVKNLLVSNWDNPGFSLPVRVKLVQQLDLNQIPFSDQFLAYVTKGAGNYTSAYFEKLVDGIACAITSDSFSVSLPERHFREITNPVRQALETALVELLCIPQESTLVGLIANLKTDLSVKPRTIHAIGLILANLPFCSLEFLIREITSDPTFLDGFSIYHLSPLLLKTTHSLNTPLTSLLTLFHSTFHYSSNKALSILPNLVENFGIRIQSQSHFNILISLVGPILPRIIGTNILEESLCALVKISVYTAMLTNEGKVFLEMAKHYHACLTNANGEDDEPGFGSAVEFLTESVVQRKLEIEHFQIHPSQDPQSQDFLQRKGEVAKYLMNLFGIEE